MTAKSSYSKNFLRFAVPSTMSMLVFSVYTMIDGIFVSYGVGELALASVNLSMPYINGIFAIGVFLAVGTSTVVSVLLGQGNNELANRVFSQNTVLLIIVSLIITAAVQVFAHPIAIFLGATESTLENVISYLRIVSLFTVSFIAGYGLEVLVKAGGHPALSLISMLACFLCNVVLDYLFVIILKWGIKGAAWATGIAQTTGFVIFLIHFLKGHSAIKFVRFKPFLSVYRRILPLGISDFSSELSIAFVTFIYNRTCLSVIGEGGVVTYSVINYLNNLVIQIMTGVTQGMQPLVSREVGKKCKSGERAYFRLALLSVASCAIVIFAVCQFFTPLITSMVLSSNSPFFLETAASVKLFSISFIIVGFNLCCAGYLTACEKPISAMLISFSRGLIFVCASLFILSRLLGSTGIWISTAVSEGACLLLTLFLVFKAKKN